MTPRGSRKTKSAKKHFCEPRGCKRVLCSDLVRLSWSEPGGARRAEIAVLENMSRAGVGLFLGVQIPDGSEIKIAGNDVVLTGSVRRCVFRENGYVVGVDLNEDSRWAQEPDSGFVPEHLLDVSLLDLKH